MVLRGTTHPIVAGVATGCLEVSTSVFPFTAWRCSFMHSAFENVAATVSGAESAYRALRKKGKLDREFRFVAFGGDGGTYDIGLQSLSGALERGHRFVYVCYDNQAYMNTGIQRSSSTPLGADTTTNPVGKKSFGKTVFPKDLTSIVAAHRIPYVGQASISHWKDFSKKIEKAFEADGPAFLNVLSPCVPGWKYPAEHTVELAKLAVETCYWPLFEVDNGTWKLNYRPRDKKPISEWTKLQGRFRHLHREKEHPALTRAQEDVDRRWEELLVRCGVESSASKPA
jgi:pyruvate ferredoxin oxidoreductase beta subunit